MHSTVAPEVPLEVVQTRDGQDSAVGEVPPSLVDSAGDNPHPPADVLGGLPWCTLTAAWEDPRPRSRWTNHLSRSVIQQPLRLALTLGTNGRSLPHKIR